MRRRCFCCASAIALLVYGFLYAVTDDAGPGLRGMVHRAVSGEAAGPSLASATFPSLEHVLGWSAGSGDHPAPVARKPGFSGFCALLYCTRFGPEAPRLLAAEPTVRGDDAMALGAVLASMAAAAMAGFNFAGVCASTPPSTSTGRLSEALDALFGANNSAQLLIDCAEANVTTTFENVTVLDRERSRVLNRSTVLLSSAASIGGLLDDRETIAALAELVAALPMSATASLSWQLAPHNALVVFHLSHNSAGQGVWRSRPIFKLAEILQNNVKDVDVHGWLTPPPSGVLSKDPDTEIREIANMWNVGIKVHNSSVMSAWGQLLRADVLAVETSAPSFLIAALNPRCVVFFGKDRQVLPGWFNGDEATPALTVQLRGCLARATHRAEPKGSFCQLPICVRYGSDAPAVFVAEHSDGAGHRMKNILEGMAVAARNGLNFGGVVAPIADVTEHGQNFRTLVNGFFGDGGALELLRPTKPNFTAKFESTKELEDQLPKMPKRALLFLPSAEGWDWNLTLPINASFSESLCQDMRANLLELPLDFVPGRPWVALHVRRGDLNRDDSRATPNEHYYKLIEHVRRHLPDADVHVWSSIRPSGSEHNGKTFVWNQTDFDGFRDIGVQVHLDDDSLLVPWAHMARAHVFIQSASSFSHVPAVVNPNCVISHHRIPVWDQIWIGSADELAREANSTELRRCISRGLPSRVKPV